MLILAVDTSTRYRSMALLLDEQVLAEVSDTEQSPYSERLFRDLCALQQQSPFQVRDIDLFAVASGPGSFTGLRVGLAAVKGWSEVYGKPIAAISALEAIAAQSKAHQGTVVAYFDARRGQVFGAAYGLGGPKSLTPVGEEVLLPAVDFVTGLRKSLRDGLPTFVSPSPESIPQVLIQSAFPGAGIENVSPALATYIGRLGLEKAARGELVDALTLEANYVRRSDAELYGKGA